MTLGYRIWVFTLNKCIRIHIELEWSFREYRCKPKMRREIYFKITVYHKAVEIPYAGGAGHDSRSLYAYVRDHIIGRPTSRRNICVDQRTCPPRSSIFFDH